MVISGLPLTCVSGNINRSHYTACSMGDLRLIGRQLEAFKGSIHMPTGGCLRHQSNPIMLHLRIDNCGVNTISCPDHPINSSPWHYILVHA